MIVCPCIRKTSTLKSRNYKIVLTQKQIICNPSSHKPCQQTGPAWDAFFSSPQVLPGPCLQCGLPTRTQPPWTPPAPLWILQGLQEGGTAVPPHSSQGVRGISVVLEHLLPFLLLPLVSAGLLPPYSHYSLQLQFLLHSNFSPLPPSQMGSAWPAGLT